jgi:AraC-like DNA-binding protein
MNIRPFFAALFSLPLVFLIIECAWADDLQQCVRFLAPEQRSTIHAPVCTLGIAASCKPIAQVEIMVRYIPAHANSAIVDTIARLKGPSFCYLWNLSSIPNQLTMGIGIIIEVTFTDGEMFGTRREGIFLAHQKIDYPVLKPLAYDFPQTSSFTQDTFEIPVADLSCREFAQMYWNERSIVARVVVRDPFFNSGPGDNLLDRMGIQICADPEKKRSLYPSDKVLIVSVPLSGQPFRQTFQPTFNDDGTYQLDSIKTRLNLSYFVDKQTNKGFSLTVTIPAYLFGKSLPPDMGFNIVVTTNDAYGNLVVSSFINAEGYNNFSPRLWPTLTLLPKPITKVYWIIWLVCFLAGIVAPLLVYLIYASFTKASPEIMLGRRSDAEQKEFGRIRKIIDLLILQPDITGAKIAGELQISQQHLKKQVKRATGLSFMDYCAYLRTEIVCERLRSSDATDKVIAATSGFRDVKEMRRCFRRFYRMSPENFRETQKIVHV